MRRTANKILQGKSVWIHYRKHGFAEIGEMCGIGIAAVYVYEL
jgi:hypothetical protein